MTVAVLGEALIDFIGEDGDAYRPHLGGSPFNVARALARQGVAVRYHSPLSRDRFGRQLAAAMRDDGVELAAPAPSDRPTSLALVTLDERGAATYRLYREGIADKDYVTRDVLANVDPDTRVFHTGSLAITPGQLPKVRAIIEALRERQVAISLDVNIRLGASADERAYLDGVQSLLPVCDIVKASDEDLAALLPGRTARDAAQVAHRQMGGGWLVLTLGAQGAVLLSDGPDLSRPPAPVDPLIDTVGAGDTFHAAFLAELIELAGPDGSLLALGEEQRARALRYACEAAAINCGRAGCVPPVRTEVLKRLDLPV